MSVYFLRLNLISIFQIMNFIYFIKGLVIFIVIVYFCYFNFLIENNVLSITLYNLLVVEL